MIYNIYPCLIYKIFILFVGRMETEIMISPNSVPNFKTKHLIFEYFQIFLQKLTLNTLFALLLYPTPNILKFSLCSLGGSRTLKKN